MLKLGRVTKFKILFLVLVFVFNFDLFKFSAAILEKGLLPSPGGLKTTFFFSVFPYFRPSVLSTYLLFFQIPNHIESDCPLTLIACPYVKTGCEIKVCKLSTFALMVSVWPYNARKFTRYIMHESAR